MRGAAAAVISAAVVLLGAPAAQPAEPRFPGAPTDGGSLVPEGDHIADRDARRQLARLLAYEPGRRGQALAHYRRLLDAEPDDPELATEAAELLYWMGRPGEAARLLASLPEQAARTRASLLLQARIESELGRAGRARDILEGLQPLQGRAERLPYADALIRSGALHRAEGVLRELLAQEPEASEPRLRLGDLLQAQGRYYAAEHQYTRLLVANPEDEAVQARLERLAETAGFRHHHARQRAAAEDPLALPPLARFATRPARDAAEDPGPRAGGSGDPSPSIQVPAAPGVHPAAPLDTHGAPEDPGGPPAGAPEAAQGKATPDPEGALERLEAAERLVEQDDLRGAEAAVRAALAHDPELTTARYRHADLLIALGELERAASQLEALAERFPDATQPRLALARLASWQGDLERSRQLYDALAAAHPQDPTFGWEAARVAWWAGDAEEARRRYEALLAGPAEAEGAERGQQPPDAAGLEAAEPPLSGLEAGLRVHEAPIAAHPDYPRYAVQRAIHLEGRAKVLVRDRRPLEALSVLERSAAFQPGNQEALYDQAQLACSLGLCDRERAAYHQLLEVAPWHGQARQSLALLERERSPQAGAQAAYSSESGEETELETRSYGLHAGVPLAERARAEVAVDRLAHEFEPEPEQGEELERTRGRRVQATLSGVATPRLRYRAGLAHTRLDADAAADATEASVHAAYRPADRWRAAGTLALERVLRNARTATDRIDRRVGALELDHSPDRRIDLASRAELADYSDGNRGLLLQLQPRARITEHPRELTLGWTLQYRDYAEDDEDLTNGENGNTDTYPYWTPQRYVANRLLLEWRHDLAEVLACRALAHHYRLRVEPYADNDGNSGARWSAAYTWDATDHLQLSADAFLERSDEWDTEGVSLSLTWHFH